MTALATDQYDRIQARDAALGKSGDGITLTQPVVDRRVLLREVRRLRAAVKAALPFVRTCIPPDMADGWTLCTHGQTWPCDQTRAAWVLRGLDPDVEYEKAMKSARADLALAELEGEN